MRTILLMCATVLALAACSGKSAGGSERSPVTVGFSQVGAESEWRTANTASVKAALAAPEFRLGEPTGQFAEETQLVLEFGIDFGVRFVAAGGDVEVVHGQRTAAQIEHRRDMA